MSAVFCKDIFDGIYVNVRGSYIANLYSSKTKSTNYTKNINEDENSNVKDIIDPKVLAAIDWKRLERLATDEEEAKATAINPFQYNEFLDSYKSYVERWCPCAN